jgi:hypothetical protein
VRRPSGGILPHGPCGGLAAPDLGWPIAVKGQRVAAGAKVEFHVLPSNQHITQGQKGPQATNVRPVATQ